MFKPRLGKMTEIEVAQVLKQLGNPKHLKILDLCCGEGRHSIVFSRKGHEVAGLDYSNNFLKVARAQAIQSKASIRFVKGDMKKTSQYFSKESFDLVTSLYNSFGYFDKRSDDIKTIKEVNKILKTGGYFIINTINGEGAKLRLAKPLHSGYELSKNFFMLDHAYLDLKKMRTYAKWTIIDARKKKTTIFKREFGQNVYTHQQLKSILKKNGFKIVKTWGLLKGEVFDEKKSWHQTILAQKVK